MTKRNSRASTTSPRRLSVNGVDQCERSVRKYLPVISSPVEHVDGAAASTRSSVHYRRRRRIARSIGNRPINQSNFDLHIIQLAFAPMSNVISVRPAFNFWRTVRPTWNFRNAAIRRCLRKSLNRRTPAKKRKTKRTARSGPPGVGFGKIHPRPDEATGYWHG